MAENTTNKKTKIVVPRLSGGAAPDVFCSINGVNYIVPRGKPVEVPDFVAEEIRRAQEAEEFMYREKDRIRNITP